MVLIDETYFTGELSLPNIPVSTPSSDGVALAIQTVGEKGLDIFVDKYVVDFLIRLFGRELTKAFLSGLEEETPLEIWINLKGLLLTRAGSYKASPLAGYVYYWLMRDARTKTTQAGESDPNFDNAENVNNCYKMVKAWNDMASMALGVHKWFCQHAREYERYTGSYQGRNVCSITQTINTFGI